MIEESIEKFKEKYRAVCSIFCPAFNQNISFNAKGLNHIFYAGNRSERNIKDIETRIRIFDRAVKLLRIVTTLSGYSCDNRASKPLHYWEFIGLIDNRRIKVIIKQRGDGEKHFWSVIPAWKVENGVIVNSSGKVNY
jgi:hypothetical protein